MMRLNCVILWLIVFLSVATQIAHVFLFARLMRWLLSPTPQNFAMIPQIMRPTPAQVHVPHYAASGLHVLPAVRDALIRGEVQLAESIGHVEESSYIRFKWDFRIEQALDEKPDTGMTTISRLLATCASDAQHWSCGRNFLANAPPALEQLRIVHHQHGWRSSTDSNASAS